MELSKRVTVIIVNFNTSSILRDCLLNLRALYSGLEIIIVDNASTDDSLKMLSGEFPGVTVIANKENKGLAKAQNQGLEKATGDYILYLGSDAFPKTDCLAMLVQYMEENKTVGIATCKLVLRSGELDMDAHRGFPTPWASLCHFSGLNKIFKDSPFFNQYFLAGRNMNEPHEIDLCISHFMLIRREVFFDLDGWDEDYFVFGEDVDFCYRAKEKGWKIMYIPTCEAIHYKGSSIGTRPESQDITKASPETKRMSRIESVRAMKLFYKKNYSKKYPKIVSIAVILGISLLGYLRSNR